MGWLTDMLQGIPINAVLKERLALEEQKFKNLQGDNKKLTDQLPALAAENERLKRKGAELTTAQQREAENPEFVAGCHAFGGDQSIPYCVACYEREGRKHPMNRVRHMGSQCTVCGKMVHR